MASSTIPNSPYVGDYDAGLDFIGRFQGLDAAHAAKMAQFDALAKKIQGQTHSITALIARIEQAEATARATGKPVVLDAETQAAIRIFQKDVWPDLVAGELKDCDDATLAKLHPFPDSAPLDKTFSSEDLVTMKGRAQYLLTVENWALTDLSQNVRTAASLHELITIIATAMVARLGQDKARMIQHQIQR